jgi:hypothetical protein
MRTGTLTNPKETTPLQMALTLAAYPTDGVFQPRRGWKEY